VVKVLAGLSGAWALVLLVASIMVSIGIKKTCDSYISECHIDFRYYGKSLDTLVTGAAGI
jgi:hypothetical protein